MPQKQETKTAVWNLYNSGGLDDKMAVPMKFKKKFEKSLKNQHPTIWEIDRDKLQPAWM